MGVGGGPCGYEGRGRAVDMSAYMWVWGLQVGPRGYEGCGRAVDMSAYMWVWVSR